MKTYKIQTAAGETEFLEAERVEEENNTLRFFVGDELVGRYVGSSSFGVYQTIPEQTTGDQPTE